MLQTVQGTLASVRGRSLWATEARSLAPSDALDLLARFGTRITMKRGRELFAEGNQSEDCYRLVDGCVRLVKLMSDGRRQICAFLKPGDLLGFNVDDTHYFSAETVSECTLVRYSRRAVETLLTDDKGFARYVRKVAARGLQDAYQRMVLLCHKSVQERIAWFLLEMADQSGTGNTQIHLPMTRTDIANYLGMAIETVSRVLGQFKHSGAILQNNLHRIQVVDRDALELARGEV